jgi:hypothetical protein
MWGPVLQGDLSPNIGPADHAGYKKMAALPPYKDKRPAFSDPGYLQALKGWPVSDL